MGRNWFLAADGAKLAFRDDGSGVPLLALAGLTRDGRDFDYLARHLKGVRLIRLDSRGRGGSDWTGPDSYTVGQEASDALGLLDYLKLERVAVLGTSRGGLLGMVMVSQAPARIAGLCFNDVGPVLERDGLLRIGAYIGVRPAVTTLEEVADRMSKAMPGFDGVAPMRWAEEAIRHYEQLDDGVALPYDPALRVSFDKAMAGPLGDAWPLFEACGQIPLALIRAANSDVLSRATAEAMLERRPDMRYASVPDRGHVPFLDEPEALVVMHEWLRSCFPGAVPLPEVGKQRRLDMNVLAALR